jgi:tRNA(Ile)-lysidine synthase
MTLPETALRTIRRYRLLRPGDRVLVALSGGADSVALLLVLRELAAAGEFDLVGAAHLNHQLRGADALADERFCKKLVTECGLPLDVERLDVGRLAADAAVSLEHAAHTARHDFFTRAASRLDATIVAVAHTRDDQAETFLLRLLRGAGPRGLGGMHPRSGIVVRPFLESSRADIRQFLARHRVTYCEDASNADVSIPRNRIRHELIPYLQGFSPGIVEVLDREAAIARDDDDVLEKAASGAAAALTTHTAAGGVEIDAAGLLAQPPAIARRVIRNAQRVVSGAAFMSFDAVDAVLAFAVSNAVGPIDLPGHRVNRRGDAIVLTKSVGRRSGGASNRAMPRPIEFTYELGVPGFVRVDEASCAISADLEVLSAGESVATRWWLASRGDQAVIEAAHLRAPLVVRNRRRGDSFRPLGLAGHKKLQDFFIDAKVVRTDRDSVPLIVDSNGRIVWVAGHAVAEDFRVTDRTRAVVILKRLPVMTGCKPGAKVG